MKTKEFKSLRNRIALIASLKVILYSIIAMTIIVLIIDGLLNDFLAEWLVRKDSVLYYFMVAHKSIAIDIIFALTFSIVSFFVFRNSNNALVEVVKSMDNVLNKPEDEIKLSNDLSIVERRLNSIRVDLITSRNNEKEAISKKNDLIMYMAHDLKTPLTSVIGYLSLLSNEKSISDDIRNKYIDIALEKAYRLEELTNEFFEITRYNLSEMVINKNKLDLSLLINQLVDESYPSLQEKSLSIEVIKDEHIEYLGDGDKLARAIGNLIKNAISYSYPDSVIYINVNVLDSEIKLSFKNKGDKIPKYKLDRLFDKFYRADESRGSKTGGTGLGLAISKEITELHGGSISVNNDDEFIEFVVILPREKKD